MRREGRIRGMEGVEEFRRDGEVGAAVGGLEVVKERWREGKERVV